MIRTRCMWFGAVQRCLTGAAFATADRARRIDRGQQVTPMGDTFPDSARDSDFIGGLEQADDDGEGEGAM